MNNKMDPVIHFEMPAEDTERVRKFYESAFGWQTTPLGPEAGDFVLAFTIETDEKTRMPKKRGAINGGGSKDGKQLVERFAAVWTGFAKEGVPKSALTPAWPAYDAEKRATMIFDVDTRVVNDHRREFRLLWDELGATPAGS